MRAYQESAYEEMKFQADAYIREHAKQYGYPLSVVNPSTVVGPRPTGETEQTGGIGLLIGAVQKGLMPVVPGGKSFWYAACRERCRSRDTCILGP